MNRYKSKMAGKVFEKHFVTFWSGPVSLLLTVLRNFQCVIALIVWNPAVFGEFLKVTKIMVVERHRQVDKAHISFETISTEAAFTWFLSRLLTIKFHR